MTLSDLETITFSSLRRALGDDEDLNPSVLDIVGDRIFSKTLQQMDVSLHIVEALGAVLNRPDKMDDFNSHIEEVLRETGVVINGNLNNSQKKYLHDVMGEEFLNSREMSPFILRTQEIINDLLGIEIKKDPVAD